jgi:hypothetical protein
MGYEKRVLDSDDGGIKKGIYHHGMLQKIRLGDAGCLGNDRSFGIGICLLHVMVQHSVPVSVSPVIRSYALSTTNNVELSDGSASESWVIPFLKILVFLWLGSSSPYSIAFPLIDCTVYSF